MSKGKLRDDGFRQAATRPLPDFDKWLLARGHDTRGGDFEPFLAMMDLVQRTQLQKAGDQHNDRERALLRMWQGMSFAAVELCNLEHQKHKRPAEEIACLLPRAMGMAAFYAMASIVSDDAPMRSIAKVLIEEFRFAAKEAADDYTEKLGLK